MGATAVDLHREVEFKFRVAADFDLTSILNSFFAGEIAATPDQPRTMSATYFDTPSAALLRWGITMRNRTGGTDAGWHLKLPTFGEKATKGATKRIELHASGDMEHPPAQFMSVIGILLRDSDVTPIARVDTERKPFYIVRDQEHIIEVVDDQVAVFQGEDKVDSFREIEVELLNPQAMDIALRLSKDLLAAGASPSSVSKAAAAFGPVVTQQPDVPLLPKPKKSALPYEIVRWAIAQQALAVIQAELSSHLHGSTSDLLIQLQRLAALLQSLSNFLDPSESAEFLAEITWLISEFSSTDQLAQEHLLASDAVRYIEDPLDRHEAQLVIDSYFERKALGAQSSARAAQRSDRYLYLFSDLMDFARVPPVSESAFQIEKLWRNIDPKRKYIAAEILAPVFPKKTAKILKNRASKSPNEVASVHELLRRIVSDPATTVTGAFALGTAVGSIQVGDRDG